MTDGEGRFLLAQNNMSVAHWPEIIADPILCAAILDRLVHHNYSIELKGKSMRKQKSPQLTLP